ncbi:MAG TPA: hypothetical protein VGM03_14630 [Phycisphaerae bacterium]|jgi:hypothetical protein
MTWTELAEIQRAIAQHLMTTKDPRFVRGVCSRAYYAGYALVTARLPESMLFGRGWRNPEHARLPGYVNQISGVGEIGRRAIRRALRRLRHRREDADYRPGITVDTSTALQSMRDVAEIFSLLNRSP